MTEECAHPVKIPRIKYVDFETSISERHGIVCENWPLPNFCAPGSLNSLMELEILHQAWSTGVTTFRKMSPEEHQQFKEARVQRRLQAAIVQANAAALAAQQNAPVTQSLSSGSSLAPIPQPLTPNGTPSPNAVSKLPTDTQEPVTADSSLTAMHRSKPVQSSASQSTPPTMKVDAQLSTSPANLSTTLPEQLPVASSSTVTLESLSSPEVAGPSTFVFSTGKRPPPSQFNILGPMGLMPKKPRKKRADAGMKRGPNKRTKSTHADAEAAPTKAPAETEAPDEEEGAEEQQRQTPTDVGGESLGGQVTSHAHSRLSAPGLEIQYVMPDPGGTTSVFRVQAQPSMQVRAPLPNNPPAEQEVQVQPEGLSGSA
ncbi:uncharacterized protein PHACADRAFT_264479 [Phanerochaete carnosa HHB-10118-sp]|uniref:Uncharacterized protein n=1 Tax=Phanerochaete carnosa (strain HHB-10118-sp) TaxID=650164 RepID=K5WID9_PHACS|nr:uncharacterized protein PHACADRAFT_264479 [Phanerochaete carnosa HHB-10118-sp]EKM50002.1 hypothetical protein PHACADRAFT_264479 [Phanerochaete carnosa HHB-10118-sp]